MGRDCKITLAVWPEPGLVPGMIIELSDGQQFTLYQIHGRELHCGTDWWQDIRNWFARNCPWLFL
jgi:hypothetical protein